jgi:hypothetical protein
LALFWNLENVRPELKPNKNTKDEDNKQKPIVIRPLDMLLIVAIS